MSDMYVYMYVCMYACMYQELLKNHNKFLVCLHNVFIVMIHTWRIKLILILILIQFDDPSI